MKSRPIVWVIHNVTKLSSSINYFQYEAYVLVGLVSGQVGPDL